jgi:hypothetical protein
LTDHLTRHARRSRPRSRDDAPRTPQWRRTQQVARSRARRPNGCGHLRTVTEAGRDPASASPRSSGTRCAACGKSSGRTGQLYLSAGTRLFLASGFQLQPIRRGAFMTVAVITRPPDHTRSPLHGVRSETRETSRKHPVSGPNRAEILLSAELPGDSFGLSAASRPAFADWRAADAVPPRENGGVSMRPSCRVATESSPSRSRSSSRVRLRSERPVSAVGAPPGLCRRWTPTALVAAHPAIGAVPHSARERDRADRNSRMTFPIHPRTEPSSTAASATPRQRRTP